MEACTGNFAIHPYFGFVCLPRTTIDLGAGPVRTTPDGFRDENLPDAREPGEVRLGLFGGSVAFSIGVADDDTVAACLGRALSARWGRLVRVKNLAVPGGQQPQQLHIALRYLDQLDGVVTLDGYNEVIVPAFMQGGVIPGEFPLLPVYVVLQGAGLAGWRFPWLRFLAAVEARWPRVRTLVGRLRDRCVRTQMDRFRSVYGPCEREVGRVIDAGSANWGRCTALLHTVCQAVGKVHAHFLQPVPERGKRLTAHEQRQVDGLDARLRNFRERGLPALEQRARLMAEHGLPVHDLRDVFAAEPGDMYGDLVHFTAAGCRVVAARMAELLR